jgi:hypothetical protein
VTLHALRGLKRAKPSFQVVQLDAHHDYSAITPGERPTHATFVGYVAAEKLAEQVVQLGVRGLTWGPPARPEGVQSVSLEQLPAALIPGLDVYVTVDTDAFDPSIAPGVGYPEPDGLPLVRRGLQYFAGGCRAVYPRATTAVPQAGSRSGGGTRPRERAALLRGRGRSGGPPLRLELHLQLPAPGRKNMAAGEERLFAFSPKVRRRVPRSPA